MSATLPILYTVLMLFAVLRCQYDECASPSPVLSSALQFTNHPPSPSPYLLLLLLATYSYMSRMKGLEAAERKAKE